MTRFAEWLSAEMAQRGWNQTQLAAYIGKRSQTVSAWFNEDRTPSPELCREVARVLHLPVEFVLEKAGHLTGADYAEPELPAWLTSVLEKLDPYELQVVGRTAQGLLALRDERQGYETHTIA